MAGLTTLTQLRQLLLARPEVEALVGDRIRPMGRKKQNETLPVVTLLRVSSRRWPTFGKEYGHVDTVVQVDCYSRTERQALELAEQVRLALQLENVGGAEAPTIRGTFLNTERDWFEEETETFRILQQWNIHHTE